MLEKIEARDGFLNKQRRDRRVVWGTRREYASVGFT